MCPPPRAGSDQARSSRLWHPDYVSIGGPPAKGSILLGQGVGEENHPRTKGFYPERAVVLVHRRVLRHEVVDGARALGLLTPSTRRI
jgi:hypothetical protein